MAAPAIGVLLLQLLERLGAAAVAFLGRLVAKWGIRRIVTALIAWGILDTVVDLLGEGNDLAELLLEERDRQSVDPMRQEDTTALQHDIEDYARQLAQDDDRAERARRVSADEARAQAEAALDLADQVATDVVPPDQIIEHRHSQFPPSRE